MRLAFPIFLATITACAAGHGSQNGPAAQAVGSELDSLDARFNRWVVAGQVDSIVGVYYAPDAILLVAGSPPVRGREQIRAVYESFYKMGTVRGRIERSTSVTADSVATDLGHYDLHILGKADTTKVVGADRGSYITAFVRRNGRDEWKGRARVIVVSEELAKHVWPDRRRSTGRLASGARPIVWSA